jgi:hypothetical protein
VADTDRGEPPLDDPSSRRGAPKNERGARNRALAAARQRRHRAARAPERVESARKADAQYRAQRRHSREYLALAPEEKHREKGRPGAPLRLRPFVGVDGEAGYRHGPECAIAPAACVCRQEYAALTVGRETLRRPDGGRISTWECLEFLTSRPKGARYVGFFFDFDVTHILLDLPLSKLREVIRPQRADHMTYVSDPYSGITYGIRFISHKFLTIVRVGDAILDNSGRPQLMRRGAVKRVPGTGSRITISDISGYFQTSFLRALEAWNIGAPGERAQVATGKAGREDFPLPLSEEVISYNVLECELMASLMTEVDRAAVAVGIELRKYHGAGTLAEALLIRHGISEFRDDIGARPRAVTAAVDRGFFGGRFETSAVGVIPEMHNFDIASAHPAAMVTLPCLAHGSWRQGWVPLNTSHPSTLFRVRWQVPASEERPFAPLPYRCRDGRLMYPLAGHGWYWKEELEVAMRGYGADNFEVLDAWEFVPGCVHKPFAWVVQLYAERLRLGKDGAGLVLKFALNALYGKLAQAAGGGGRFTEWVWAGMITARTRAQLMELALLAGRHAVMLATDGLYVDHIPLALQQVTTFAEKAPLGAWQYDPLRSVYRNALLIQSGLWVDGNRLRPARQP